MGGASIFGGNGGGGAKAGSGGTGGTAGTGGTGGTGGSGDPGPCALPDSNGKLCENGDVCDGISRCTDGQCLVTPGTEPKVDDENPCTVDQCDPVKGVTHQVDPSCGECVTDANCIPPGTCRTWKCVEKKCVGSPEGGRECSDGDFCNGVEYCGKMGYCDVGNFPKFDDHDYCTVDTCEQSTGKVEHLRLDPDCVGCDDDADCANDPCRTGPCDKSSGKCAFTAKTDGTACSDGNAGNGEETCQAGKCQAKPKP